MSSARASGPAELARGRERQRALYGQPLGDRVRRLTGALGLSQARLAQVLGISPAMLSQLVSARRVKIGDPAVLARLMLLDQRCHLVGHPPRPAAVAALLAEVAQLRCAWTPGGEPRTDPPVPAPRRPVGSVPPNLRPRSAAEALRGVSEPARLAAAAAALGPSFPELAEVLRQAAARR